MSEKLSAMLPASTGQIEILRGDFLFSGTDGDHTTNFAVLKEALTTAFKLSQDDARQVSRVTPVLQALTDMVKADMHLLENSEAIKPKELLANLDKLAKEGAEELAKTNKKYKPPKYNPEDDDEDPDKIKYAAEFIKKFFSGEGARDRQLKFKGQLKEFLWLYSQAIPYLNLDALRETLKNAEKNAINYADDLAKKWKEDAKKRVGNLNFEETQEIVKLLPDNNAKHLLQLQINKLKSATLETVTDVHLMHTRKGFAEATVERIISDYSEIMNQLPSTAYLKVPGVSGKNRHGGGATTSAMKRFQEAINNIAVLNTKLQDAKKKEEKKEDVSKAVILQYEKEKEENVNQAVINMALLLDFHPLLQKDINKKQEELDKQTNNITSPSLDTRAARIAAMRDNDPNTLAYVIARHWKAMNDTFPTLRDCEKKEREEIQDKFIEHMITRWRFADKNPIPSTEGTTAVEQEKHETINRGIGSRWEATNIDFSAFKDRVKKIISELEALSLSPISRTLSSALYHNSNSSSSSGSEKKNDPIDKEYKELLTKMSSHGFGKDPNNMSEEEQMQLAMILSLKEGSQKFDFENNRFTQELGLNCKNVRGDGFCLFRAITEQVFVRNLNATRGADNQLPTTMEDVLEKVVNYFNQDPRALMERIIPPPKREDFGTGADSEAEYTEALQEYNDPDKQHERLRDFKDNFYEYINVGRYYAGGLRNAGDWLPTVMSDVLGVDIDIYDQQLGGGFRTNNGHAQRIGLGRINNNHYISLEGNLETARAREEQAIKDRIDISSRTIISQNQSSTNAPALGKAKDEMPSMAMNVESLKPNSASTSGNVISPNTEQMKIKAHEKASSDSSVTHSATDHQKAEHQKMVSAQFIDPINTAIEKLNNFRKEMQDGHLADPEQSWRNVRKQAINQLEDQIQLKEVHAKMQELRHTITEIDREIATTHSKNQTASTVASHSHSSSSSSSSFSVTEPTADHQAKSAPIAEFRGVVKAVDRFLSPLRRKRKRSEGSTPPDSPTNVSASLREDPPTNSGRIDSMATEEKRNSHSMEITDVSRINPDIANRFSTAQNAMDALHTTESPELQIDAITSTFDTSVTQQHSPSAVRMEEMRSRPPSPQPTNDSTAQGEKIQESNTPPASPKPK